MDVSSYLQEDSRNFTPTSIVIGFNESVTIDTINLDGLDSSHELVQVTIDVLDFGSLKYDQLLELGLEEVRNRLPVDVVEAIEQDTRSAVADLGFTSTDIQDHESESIGDESVELGSRSYLADFYTELLGYKYRMTPIEEPVLLRDTLLSLLRPGVIVDGQHRVFGAANVDENMQMAVCAIPSSSWAENVYQFVVINQKAKPIKPAFLSSIIATSLSAEEVEDVYARLRVSKIDVSKAETMELVNADERSPFKDMVDFEIAGSVGFLQFPGMSTLVRGFVGIPRSHSILLAGPSWNDQSGSWSEHFFAFWWGVRDYFEEKDPRLWNQPSEGNPNNLLKIVTLQEIQGLVLDSWADSRMITLSDPEVTKAKAKHFWDGFPANFFTDEWKKKGLQTSVGRRIIRDAIMDTRRKHGSASWGHRKLGLFTGI